MLSIITRLATHLLTIIVTILTAKKIIKGRKIKIELNTVIVVGIATLLAFINIYYFEGIIRLLISIGIIILTIKYILKMEFSEAVILGIIIFISYVFVEALIIPMWLKITHLSPVDAKDSILFQFLGNATINGIIYTLFDNNFICKKTNQLLKWLNKEKNKILIIILTLVTMIILYNTYKTSVLSELTSQYFYHLLLIITAFLIIIFIINEKRKTSKKKAEFDALYEYSKTYEEWIQSEGIKRHEDKNQLIVIKSMIEHKDKDVLKYIEELIKEPTIIEYEWTRELKHIPNGGIKGLIYYKLKEMKELGINISLEVSSNIEKLNIKNLKISEYKEIFKVLGVFLDNAKDAALESSKKIIGIEIYSKNNKMNFSIYNSFKQKVDIEKLGKERISTKGKGRGYGLLLVNQIMRKHKNFTEEKQIVNNLYIQNLSIEIK